MLTRIGFARAVSSRAHAALPSGVVDRIAEMNGGNVQPRSITRTRWYIDDIESATLECDQGRMKTAAQLMRAASSDGVVMGLMSTRTAGLVRLPKRWRGDGDQPGVVGLQFVDHDQRAACGRPFRARPT